MKKIEWLTPNKMKFESLHKTFNNQVKCISTGNVIGDTQLSGFVRPYNKIECNNTQFPKGHLQNYDLSWLVSDLPGSLKDWIRSYAKDKSVIAYVFKHCSKGKKILDGFVITTAKNYKLLKVVYANDNYKVQSVIDECVKYICN